MDTVDARRTSLADLIQNYFAKGRPVVLRNALLATSKDPSCIEAQRLYVVIDGIMGALDSNDFSLDARLRRFSDGSCALLASVDGTRIGWQRRRLA